MDGRQLCAKATGAVLEALRADDIAQLPNLPGIEKLWEQFDDNKQDDASHFLICRLGFSSRSLPTLAGSIRLEGMAHT